MVAVASSITCNDVIVARITEGDTVTIIVASSITCNVIVAGIVEGDSVTVVVSDIIA